MAADRLAAELDSDHAVGYVDVSFYRDDLSTSGLKANVRSTQIPSFRCRMRISFWSMTCCSPGAPYAQRSIRCSTLADRPRCNWRCWLTAVAARFRWPPTTWVRPLIVARDLMLALDRDESGKFVPTTEPWKTLMLSKKNLQLNDNGDLHHLLAIEGLPKRIIERILDTAESFVGINEREVKVVPLLRGKSIFNIFFENSTRNNALPSKSPPSACRPTS